tara:strand:- start:62 stop:400 length:339 start_codon:yes stop_codon:yes gene_type:complete
MVGRLKSGSSLDEANYQLFLSGLCEALGLPRPLMASAENARNDYVLGLIVVGSLRIRAAPLFVAMPDANDEYVGVALGEVDDEMGLEGMDADRWRELSALAGHVWVGGDQSE